MKLDKKIALELNGEIIPKQMYKKKFVKNEDIIEIVHLLAEDKVDKRSFNNRQKKI